MKRKIKDMKNKKNNRAWKEDGSYKMKKALMVAAIATIVIIAVSLVSYFAFFITNIHHPS